MDSRVRKIFRPIVHLIALILNRLGFPPNSITLLSLLFAIAAFFAFFVEALGMAIIFIFLSGLFDGVDGELAKISGRKTKFGGFLDSVLDRYADGFIVLGAAMYLEFQSGIFFIDPIILGILTIVGFIMVSYTRARAEKEGIACEVGIGARSERLLLLIIFAFVNQLYIGLVILCIISNLTAMYRVLYVYAITKYGQPEQEV
jgi:phosphatidylglycerophosphate synthase